MKFASIFVLILLPVLVIAATIRETKELVLSADGLDTFVANCGAGSLNLHGAVDRNEIKVTAQIEVEDIEANDFQEFVQKNIRLKLEKQGKKAILQSDIEPSAIVAPEARINLTIEIPKTINVKISDGSGSIIVDKLRGTLKIDDDTGSIKIKNIIGEVFVDDSSGSIDIEDIKGNLFIKDGSGSINVEFVTGDMQIKDGSGSMTIEDIDGNVNVTDDSGSIDIHDVKKNVFIRQAGSGELNIEGVKGKVTIRGE
ncbi:MAG: hypothetical protein JSV31_05325 [Desulfobacterales bacterium]|nr:MAG: hypothetical protein JSV31_05325 [Desulfobacterales bacterium]